LTSSYNDKEEKEKEKGEKKNAAAEREKKMKLIKELDDIIQKTPEGEIRNDLEFTRDKLLFSLYEDDEEKEKEKGEKKK
jgi:hypothetical protein